MINLNESCGTAIDFMVAVDDLVRNRATFELPEVSFTVWAGDMVLVVYGRAGGKDIRMSHSIPAIEVSESIVDVVSPHVESIVLEMNKRADECRAKRTKDSP